jgi:integrase
MMGTGLHIVGKKRRGKSKLWYVYAWRGGPPIHSCEGTKPKVTAALTDLAAEARRERKHPVDDISLAAQIALFKGSPEFRKLAASTRANYGTWLSRIQTEFGDTTLRMWLSREMRGDVLDWRDKWEHQPRSADEAVKVISRLMNWIVDRGRLPVNVLAGIDQLYEVDRSDLIWEPKHFEAFEPHSSVEVQEGVELAACTGLRRGDLVNLPWAAIGPHAIVWRTSKSRGKNLITIPLLPETHALLNRIKARHEREMASKPPAKRKPLPETVLSNSRWETWQPGGFGSRFNDAKIKSGIDRHLHDLRGTFATRCMIAGLTDQEIANILGWEPKNVAAIRAKYVSDARVVVAIGERIARGSG